MIIEEARINYHAEIAREYNIHVFGKLLDHLSKLNNKTGSSFNFRLFITAHCLAILFNHYPAVTEWIKNSVANQLAAFVIERKYLIKATFLVCNWYYPKMLYRDLFKKQFTKLTTDK